MRVLLRSTFDNSTDLKRILCVSAVLLFAYLFHATPVSLAQEPLLQLSFEGNLVGTDGEAPVSNTDIEFVPGIWGLAANFDISDTAEYESLGNIDSQTGTVDFVVIPNWDGNDSLGHEFLVWVSLPDDNGGGLSFLKDGANNLRQIYNRFSQGGQSEIGTAINVSDWVAGDPHYIAFTWDTEQRQIRQYVDGALVSTFDFPDGFVLPTISNPVFRLGGQFQGADSAIDELRIFDRVLSPEEISVRCDELFFDPIFLECEGNLDLKIGSVQQFGAPGTLTFFTDSLVHPDGSLWVVGRTDFDYGQDVGDGPFVLLAKIGKNGEFEQIHLFDGLPADGLPDDFVFFATNLVATRIQLTSDNNFLIAGSGRRRIDNSTIFDSFVFKTTPNGKVLWQREIVNDDQNRITCILTDELGNSYVAGMADGEFAGPSLGEVDAFLIKLDTDGVTIWERQFGTANFDGALTLARNLDGQIIVGGFIDGDVDGDQGMIAVFSESGDQLALDQFDLGEFPQINDLNAAADGGLIIAGVVFGEFVAKNQSGVDSFVAKLSVNGELTWAVQFPNSSTSTPLRLLSRVGHFPNLVVNDDSIWVFESSQLVSGSGLHDIRLVELGLDGTIQGCSSFGTMSFDSVTNVTQGINGLPVLIGHSSNTFVGDCIGNQSGFVMELRADVIDLIAPATLPRFLDSGGEQAFEIEVISIDGVSNAESVVMMLDTGNGFEPIALTESSENSYTVEFPPTTSGTDVRYFFSAIASDGSVENLPVQFPPQWFTAVSGPPETVSFTDDFEIDLGWQVTGDAVTGQWERGIPDLFSIFGQRGAPLQDADGSGACYLTENFGGDSDVDEGFTTLISPTFDGTAADGMASYASYYRWHASNTNCLDEQELFLVEISNDGGASWTQLETVEPESLENNGGWILKTFKIQNSIFPTQQMNIRFTVMDTDTPSLIESGVDGFEIYQLADSSVLGDINCDGNVDLLDIGPFVDLLTSGEFSAKGDINGDGEVSLLDVGPFVQLISGG